MFAPHRARFVGTRHMAASGHYLATQAAMQILEGGGNAIDAAVAGGIALGVLQSEYVGFGGVAPIMIYSADQDHVVTISGLGTWPALTDPEFVRREHGGIVPPGILRTVVPAAPDAWITALELYGTLSYGECAAAALRFAREGFIVPSLMSSIVGTNADNYRRWPQNAAIYLPDDEPLETGRLFVQSDLADTIQYLIDEEKAASARGRLAGLSAARDAFYKGDIARRIVAYHEAHGGWMRAGDLAGFRVEIGEPVSVHALGAEILTCGPWCQGPVLAQTLALLRDDDLALLGHNSAAYIHLLAEALKRAFSDRHSYYGDPKFVDVPMAALLSDDYARRRRAEIDMTRAHPDMPEPGLGTGGAPQRPVTGLQQGPEDPDTSYICVVDRHGNAVSATPSDPSATAPVIPGLGFVPSPRGSQAFADPSAAAQIAPGWRPRLTPSPAIARRKGEWIMPFGTPGDDVQPQTMLQVLLNMLVFGMTPQEAIDAPRFATLSFPRTSMPHVFEHGLMLLESRIAGEVRAALGELGHRVIAWPEWEYAAGGVCLVRNDSVRGTYEGASDPRRPTSVAGW